MTLKSIILSIAAVASLIAAVLNPSRSHSLHLAANTRSGQSSNPPPAAGSASFSPTIRTALITAASSLTAAIVVAFVTYYIADRNIRANYQGSIKSEIVKVRLQAYPELFEIILLMSSRYPQVLTDDEKVELGHRVNSWLYGRGGLYASYATRGLTADLRAMLLDKKNIDEIRGVRDNLIYTLRADINLEGDLDIDPERAIEIPETPIPGI